MYDHEKSSDTESSLEITLGTLIIHTVLLLFSIVSKDMVPSPLNRVVFRNILWLKLFFDALFV